MRRALRALTTPLRRAGNWLMDTKVDQRVCQWVEETKGADER